MNKLSKLKIAGKVIGKVSGKIAVGGVLIAAKTAKNAVVETYKGGKEALIAASQDVVTGPKSINDEAVGKTYRSADTLRKKSVKTAYGTASKTVRSVKKIKNVPIQTRNLKANIDNLKAAKELSKTKKAIKKTEKATIKTAKNTKKATIKTAKNTAKGTVKVAEKAAVKTAKNAARAAGKLTAKTAALAAQAAVNGAVGAAQVGVAVNTAATTAAVSTGVSATVTAGSAFAATVSTVVSTIATIAAWIGGIFTVIGVVCVGIIYFVFFYAPDVSYVLNQASVDGMKDRVILAGEARIQATYMSIYEFYSTDDTEVRDLRLVGDVTDLCDWEEIIALYYMREYPSTWQTFGADYILSGDLTGMSYFSFADVMNLFVEASELKLEYDEQTEMILLTGKYIPLYSSDKKDLISKYNIPREENMQHLVQNLLLAIDGKYHYLHNGDEQSRDAKDVLAYYYEVAEKGIAPYLKVNDNDVIDFSELESPKILKILNNGFVQANAILYAYNHKDGKTYNGRWKETENLAGMRWHNNIRAWDDYNQFDYLITALRILYQMYPLKYTIEVVKNDAGDGYHNVFHVSAWVRNTDFDMFDMYGFNATQRDLYHSFFDDKMEEKLNNEKKGYILTKKDIESIKNGTYFQEPIWNGLVKG